MKALLAIFLLLIAGHAAGEVAWREFSSADGSKSFVGQLEKYQEAEGMVTVRMKADLKPVSFELSRLSKADQGGVKIEGPKLPVRVAVSLVFDKIMDLRETKRDDGNRTKVYDGGYKIRLRNYSDEWIRDVEVDYIVIYRKGETDERGEVVYHTGTKKIAQLAPKIDDMIMADGIVLENHFEAGKATFAERPRMNIEGPAGATATVTKAQKRRDTLLGCIVQMKVGGKVVLTEASSVDTLRDYRDAFKDLKKPAEGGTGKEVLPGR